MKVTHVKYEDEHGAPSPVLVTADHVHVTSFPKVTGSEKPCDS